MRFFFLICFLISVTLESTIAVEWPSEDTCVLHNVIKRVWPASQRDALFWSHKRHLQEDSDDKPDRWIVVNYSTSHPKVPVSYIDKLVVFITIRFWFLLDCA